MNEATGDPENLPWFRSFTVDLGLALSVADPTKDNPIAAGFRKVTAALTSGSVLGAAGIHPFLAASLGLLDTSAGLEQLAQLARQAASRATKEVNRVELLDQVSATAFFTASHAFFSVFEEHAGDDFKVLELTQQERRNLAQAVVKASHETTKQTLDAQGIDTTPINFELAAWHSSLLGMGQLVTDVRRIHALLGKALRLFVSKLAAWEEAPDRARTRLLNAIAAAEDQGISRFVTDFIRLCESQPSLAIWLNFAEQLGRDGGKGGEPVDVGLESFSGSIVRVLGQTVQNVSEPEGPEPTNTTHVQYLDLPILNLPLAFAEDTGLRIPTLREGYVPPRFSAVLSGSVDSLGSPRAWEEEEIRTHLGSYLAAEVTNPVRFTCPMLVMGHPGSGKSLLCKALAARLSASGAAVYLLPLRRFRVGIKDWLEEGIRDVSQQVYGRALDLRSMRSDSPVTLLLDGYDELILASGEPSVYSLLEEVQDFQHRCIANGTPVSVLVTSRMSTIDECYVPAEAPVVLLRDFDSIEIETWLKIWNANNSRGTSYSDLEDVLELARQPLLLALLCIYQAVSSTPINQSLENRGALYTALFARFLEREHERLSTTGRSAYVRSRFVALAATSACMLREETLAISLDQLADRFPEVLLAVGARPPSHAADYVRDVLGSFFFVVESAAWAGPDQGERLVYEYLHKSFLEYFAAIYVRLCVNAIANDQASDDQSLLSVLSSTPFFMQPDVLEFVPDSHVESIVAQAQPLRGEHVAALFRLAHRVSVDEVGRSGKSAAEAATAVSNVLSAAAVAIGRHGSATAAIEASILDRVSGSVPSPSEVVPRLLLYGLRANELSALAQQVQLVPNGAWQYQILSGSLWPLASVSLEIAFASGHPDLQEAVLLGAILSGRIVPDNLYRQAVARLDKAGRRTLELVRWERTIIEHSTSGGRGVFDQPLPTMGNDHVGQLATLRLMRADSQLLSAHEIEVRLGVIWERGTQIHPTVAVDFLLTVGLLGVSSSAVLGRCREAAEEVEAPAVMSFSANSLRHLLRGLEIAGVQPDRVLGGLGSYVARLAGDHTIEAKQLVGPLIASQVLGRREEASALLSNMPLSKRASLGNLLDRRCLEWMFEDVSVFSSAEQAGHLLGLVEERLSDSFVLATRQILGENDSHT